MFVDYLTVACSWIMSFFWVLYTFCSYLPTCQFILGSLLSSHISILFCGISYFKLWPWYQWACECVYEHGVLLWTGVPPTLFPVRFTMTLAIIKLTEDEWMNKDSHILRKLEKPFIISALLLSQRKHNPNMSRIPKKIPFSFIYSKQGAK